MKKNDLRDALSAIDRRYIEESDDLKAVSADFRKAKNRKIRVVSSLLCVAVVGAGLFGADKAGLFKQDPHTEQLYVDPDITTVVSSEGTESESALHTETQYTDQYITTEISTESTAGETDAHTEPIYTDPEMTSEISSDNTVTGTEPAQRTGAPLYYTKLVGNTERPEIEGYCNTAEMSIISFDIDRFREDVLANESSVVEGEILDMWVNNYEYSYTFEKFGPDGELFDKQSTVAYKIKVNRVLSGSFSAGDEITVEDVNYPIDRIVSVKKGSTYVIPIIKGEGLLYAGGEIKSGSNVLESEYYTYYPFHPQIEKVDGGYVVPDDWKTLITDECNKIIMDIPEEEISYPASLYFVPDSVFNERMSIVLNT
ncbi:MAG: hypothetical protein IKH50_07205 [Oscillospiraceae bacterium]|nr:hypothetical protein [Oscillospiraceae bacterium]